ncbi:cytochrome P450 [Rhodococcus sp. USK10]|uniref:cytochrome P450 n=1 Tax=Rhodococcus sp. USK10 TaxID=2789739 RepID=UPI001C6012C3|nr:cytochrome P450 [Rhodococcus sp. USK10]QYB04231.1 cytochrome P450 [Rhodococcus sp. USK10]
MANRDPQYYPQPDEVNFDREAKPHLAFGLGPHRCVGLHLARLELKIAFTELRRRMPKFELVSGVIYPAEHGSVVRAATLALRAAERFARCRLCGPVPRDCGRHVRYDFLPLSLE